MCSQEEAVLAVHQTLFDSFSDLSPVPSCETAKNKTPKLHPNPLPPPSITPPSDVRHCPKVRGAARDAHARLLGRFGALPGGGQASMLE